MIGWLRPALRRLSLRGRAIALAVLLLMAVILALVPTRQVGERSRRPSARATTGTLGARRGPSPVPAAQVALARGIARRFLAGYLRFAYGRASAASVRAVTPTLRQQLTRDRAEFTPVEERRRPRVVSLAALGEASGVVVAEALIADGGIASYVVRLTLRPQRVGWLVSGVDER
jgi:hypothetical protein